MVVKKILLFRDKISEDNMNHNFVSMTLFEFILFMKLIEEREKKGQKW